MKPNSWSELGRITNFDFAKVRDHVVAGYVNVKQKGYDNVICQVEIFHSSADTMRLSIVFWVLDSGQPKSFSAEQDLYGMINLPGFVVDQLMYKQKFQIRLDKEDLENIRSFSVYKIMTSKDEIQKIVKKQLNAIHIRPEKVILEISMHALYYRVLVYSADHSAVHYEYLTLSLNGLPAEITNDLDDNGKVSFILDL